MPFEKLAFSGDDELRFEEAKLSDSLTNRRCVTFAWHAASPGLPPTLGLPKVLPNENCTFCEFRYQYRYLGPGKNG